MVVVIAWIFVPPITEGVLNLLDGSIKLCHFFCLVCFVGHLLVALVLCCNYAVSYADCLLVAGEILAVVVDELAA